MVLIPEAEYLTLINMLKGRDEIGYDKAKTDAEISNVLSDKNLEEMVKSKKYDWLVKQQQSLKKKMDKPQKIVIDKDQLQNIFRDFSNYLGISAPISRPSKALSQTPQVLTTPTFQGRQRKLIATPVETEESEYESSFEDAPEISQSTSYIVHPNYKNDLIKIFKQRKTGLKIDKFGSFKDDEGREIGGSNYEDVVKYLTGEIEEKPIGTDTLINRIKDEAFFKKAMNWSGWHKQRGEGFRLYKRGLVRKNNLKHVKITKFKPTIWTKIQ